jgi:hypothetical protein
MFERFPSCVSFIDIRGMVAKQERGLFEGCGFGLDAANPFHARVTKRGVGAAGRVALPWIDFA